MGVYFYGGGHGVSVEIRKQQVFSFHTHEFQDSNPGRQAWQQEPLIPELSHQPLDIVLILD